MMLYSSAFFGESKPSAMPLESHTKKCDKAAERLSGLSLENGRAIIQHMHDACTILVDYNRDNGHSEEALSAYGEIYCLAVGQIRRLPEAFRPTIQEELGRKIRTCPNTGIATRLSSFSLSIR